MGPTPPPHWAFELWVGLLPRFQLLGVGTGGLLLPFHSGISSWALAAAFWPQGEILCENKINTLEEQSCVEY